MSNARRSVLLLGATGLVGRECLRQLIGDPNVWRIVVLLRRPLDDAPRSDKMQVEVVNFDALAARRDLFRVDQIFCALGSTIKQAGSQDAFRRVDFEYPLAAAKLGVEEGARHFLVVTALGASAKSRIFYNRVKGELEDALRTLSYRSVTIVRPSLLLGVRKKFRLSEQIAKRFGWLLPGKYKPIAATAVAAALASAARLDEPGMHIIESDEIRRLAEGRISH
ncbi:MAG: NAD-dependent epimerase [Gemmatimonadetes bacterium]|nr:NAD-dependent epimerase [Gemmatimonadota bacterium]